MDYSINKIRKTIEEIRNKSFPSEDSIKWIESCLLYLYDGEAKTLDEAFGFGSGRKIGTKLKMLRRNKAIIKRIKKYTDEGLTPWAARKKLEGEIKKFRSTTFKKMKHNKDRLHKANDLELSLFEILRFNNGSRLSMSTLSDIKDIHGFPPI